MRQPVSRETPISDRAGPAEHSLREGLPREVVPPSSAATPRRPAPGRAAFLASFAYAWQGITYVVRTQRNARVHLAVAAGVVALAAVLRVAPIRWALLLLCIVAVIAAEMMNTVVEATVDLVTDRYHPLARIAKDVAAGTVLFTAIGAVGVGLLVLGPPLWHALFR